MDAVQRPRLDSGVEVCDLLTEENQGNGTQVWIRKRDDGAVGSFYQLMCLESWPSVAGGTLASEARFYKWMNERGSTR